MFLLHIHMIGTVLWNHHRVDSSTTLQLKFLLIAFGIGTILLVAHSFWRKRLFVATLMTITILVLIQQHWTPLMLP